MFVAFILIFSINLYALSDSELLKQANKNLSSSDKNKIFKAYNTYKSIYLKAILNDNETLKQKALYGIVKSGEKLHIDITNYKKELKLKYIPQKNQNQKAKKAKKTKSKPKLLRNINKLKSIYWSNGKLVLKFDKNLKNRCVNYFKLYDAKKNIYKYVFEIEATLIKPQKLYKQGINLIKIAQYNNRLIRVVFQNDSVVKIRFKISKNKIIISANPTKSKAKKVYQHATTINYQKTKKQKTVVIDAGHGGKDSGAIGYKRYKEKDVVFAIAKYLKYELKKRGYRVYMTRDSDRFVKLRNRTKFANKKLANIFISIHANAVPKRNRNKAKGIETYFLSPSRSERAKKVAAMENQAGIDEMDYFEKQTFLSFLNRHKIIASNKLAIDIQRGVLAKLQKRYKGVVDGGVKEGPFWVLVGAQMPSILIEVGFITHPTEAKRLKNKTYQKLLAEGIADGIDRYFIYNK